MDCSKTGGLIRSLRKSKGLTQKQLADKMRLSDKTVSKWERGLGCPDVSVLSELSDILGVNTAELLNGELPLNDFVGGNMKNTRYYVCPICGNVTCCTGNAEVSCCGRRLEALIPKKANADNMLNVECLEDDWYITSNHPMEKQHYISIVILSTIDTLQLYKQYPEWNLQLLIPKREHDTLMWYCVQDGLFYMDI